MESDILLDTIFNSVTINELLKKMDDSEKNDFLEKLFEYLMTKEEAHSAQNYISGSYGSVEYFSEVYFERYEAESNSIVVSRNDIRISNLGDAAIDEPLSKYEYKISIDELQDRVNSLVSSKQSKVK